MRVPKWIESGAHVLMGFGAGLFFLGLLLHYRERKQLPPENDRYPVVWVDQEREDAAMGERSWARYSRPWLAAKGPLSGFVEYWAKPRVMDTLNDSREYWIGYTAGHVTQVVLVGVYL